MRPAHRLTCSALAFVAAGVLFLDSSPRSAHAGPEGIVITGGEQPWRSFAGIVDDHSSETVYTVPADRVFVLTSFCYANGSSDQVSGYVEILQGATIKVPTVGYPGKCTGRQSNSAVHRDPLGFGEARYTFSGGSDVIIHQDSSGNVDPAYFWMEGYLAAP